MSLNHNDNNEDLSLYVKLVLDGIEDIFEKWSSIMMGSQKGSPSDEDLDNIEFERTAMDQLKMQLIDDMLLLKEKAPSSDARVDICSIAMNGDEAEAEKEKETKNKNRVCDFIEEIVRETDLPSANTNLLKTLVTALQLDFALLIEERSLLLNAVNDGSLSYVKIFLSEVPNIQVDLVEMIPACCYNQLMRIPLTLALFNFAASSSQDGASSFALVADEIQDIWQEFFEDICSSKRAIPREDRTCRMELIEKMLAFSAPKVDVDREGNDTRTVLSRACYEEDEELVKVLLLKTHHKPQDILISPSLSSSSSEKKGGGGVKKMPVLMHALMGNNPAIVEQLLKYCDEKKISEGQQEEINFGLELGLNVVVSEEYGNAMDLAIQLDREKEILVLLKKYGGKSSVELAEERKAKEEADRKAKEEADRKAKEEADREKAKAKEEADRKKAKQEAEQQNKKKSTNGSSESEKEKKAAKKRKLQEEQPAQQEGESEHPSERAEYEDIPQQKTPSSNSSDDSSVADKSLERGESWEPSPRGTRPSHHQRKEAGARKQQPQVGNNTHNKNTVSIDNKRSKNEPQLAKKSNKKGGLNDSNKQGSEDRTEEREEEPPADPNDPSREIAILREKNAHLEQIVFSVREQLARIAPKLSESVLKKKKYVEQERMQRLQREANQLDQEVSSIQYQMKDVHQVEELEYLVNRRTAEIKALQDRNSFLDVELRHNAKRLKTAAINEEKAMSFMSKLSEEKEGILAQLDKFKKAKEFSTTTREGIQARIRELETEDCLPELSLDEVKKLIGVKQSFLEKQEMVFEMENRLEVLRCASLQQ